MHHRRAVAAVAGIAVSASLGLAPRLTAPAAATSAVVTTPRAAVPGVLGQVHTAGRVVTAGSAVRYSWPGIAFEARFRGTAVGIDLADPNNDYDVQIDGTAVTRLVQPGTGTHWVKGLDAGTHRVRLVKRTESPWATSEFGGFVAAAGGKLLTPPRPRTRQIEFIGDSHTAGYGDESTSRSCGDQLNRLSNADITYAALTAKRLKADYQLNAFSGRGMVRNYDGGDPGTSYRSYYDRALLADPADVWQRPASWKPQVVVVNLGTNDFSTALHSGEKWTSDAALVADFRTSYLAFLDKLRTVYGKAAVLVVVNPAATTTGTLSQTVARVVQARRAAGDRNVRLWSYPAGMDLLGCDWHPSAHDHALMAGKLTRFVGRLGLEW